MDYLGKLISEMEGELARLPLENRDREKIQSCLGQLQDTARSFRKTMQNAMEALFVQCIRPKLKQLCNELFSNLKYVLSEEEYAESDLVGGMPVTTTTMLSNLVADGPMGATVTKERFVTKLTGTMDRLMQDGYRQYFTANNLTALLLMCIDYVVKDWEAHILYSNVSRFNVLGKS